MTLVLRILQRISNCALTFKLLETLDSSVQCAREFLLEKKKNYLPSCIARSIAVEDNHFVAFGGNASIVPTVLLLACYILNRTLIYRCAFGILYSLHTSSTGWAFKSRAYKCAQASSKMHNKIRVREYARQVRAYICRFAIYLRMRRTYCL